MSYNPAKTINFFGQLFLLVIATVLVVLDFILVVLDSTYGKLLSISVVFFLPLLGIWQVVDFAMLWSKNGQKKWYNLYICAIIGFLLLLTLVLLQVFKYIYISISAYPNHFISVVCLSYAIIIAWIYLLYWRKK